MLSQQGEFVFVVAPGKAGELPTAEMRIVQSGQTQEDGTKVITSGLKPGEQVVIEGQVFLAPTMPLMIATLDGKPTAAAPSAAASTAAPASSAATK
jgi:multidrug efflux pump subunit AcrA (membrane-fusion protein)